MIILGFGCNIGDRLSNLRNALALIRLDPDIKVVQVSPVYESDALLLADAPKDWDQPYLNLAISIATNLEPKQLLAKVKNIEKQMGRDGNAKWSPRIIDIDLLVWNEKFFDDVVLKIPHKNILERPFALWPLADLSPDWRYCEPDKKETGKTVKELIKKFGSRFDGNAPLHTKQIAHRVDMPLMMGILNITPDSFSDGGDFNDVENAMRQAEYLFNSGADIIDVGAESTRPGSKVLTFEQEWMRLKPFLDAWVTFWRGKNFKPKLSIDTYKPETAEKLSEYPVDFLNDVRGLVNPKMQEVAKNSKAKIIFMHNLGIPADPKVTLSFDDDVVSKVYKWGKTQVENLINAGVEKERLIFDVGIGFGKSAEQSLSIIKNIDKFHGLGVPILVGHSRKSFFNQFTSKPFSQRDLETAVFSGFLASKQVDYLRIHDVEQSMCLLKIDAIL